MSSGSDYETNSDTTTVSLPRSVLSKMKSQKTFDTISHGEWISHLVEQYEAEERQSVAAAWERDQE
jgi:hypothetical protein